MKFLFPHFLWALTAIAIPIIIHLFNFRRYKKVQFTNVKFLTEVQQQSKSKQNLKKLLVLLVRCLTIIFLALAFAQPYLPAAEQQKVTAGNVVSVYVDNSFSMNAEGNEGELLEAAKNKAREIAGAYGNADQFQLVTNDFEGKHQRLVNKEEFLVFVDEVVSSPSARKLSEVLARQKEVLGRVTKKNTGKSAFLVSDFQKSVADISALKTDSSLQVYFLPLRPNKQSNLSIDSCWIATPYIQMNQPVLLKVRISNSGETAVENSAVTLKINGVQKSLASFSLEGGQHSETDMVFSISQPGWNACELSLTDNPITFDDQLFFAFEARQNIQVLNIRDKNTTGFLNKLYATDPYFVLEEQDMRQVNYGAFPGYQLIVLNELTEYSSGLADELKKFTAKGGTVAIIPPATATDLGALNNLCSVLGAQPYAAAIQGKFRTERINEKNVLYAGLMERAEKNLELPNISRYYPLQNSTRSRAESLLALGNGEDIFRFYPAGKGKIYQLAIPLNTEWSDFALNFTFPNAFLNMAIQSFHDQSLFYTIGGQELIAVNNTQGNENIFELYNTQQRMIPEVINRENAIFLSVGNHLRNAGNYAIGLKGSNTPVRQVAFNYDRRESVTDYLDNDAIEDLSSAHMRLLKNNPKGIKSLVQELDKGTQLWKWCIVFALLFITIEILLLRFLK